jgi:KDO2-lipid IV(A) lauroyltransferase
MSRGGSGMKLGKRLRYLAEAAGFYTMIGFFRLIGLDAASALCGWIGRTLIAPTGLSRLAHQNLRIVFPEIGDKDANAIVRGMWDNLGRVAAEYAHLTKISLHGKAPRIHMTGHDEALKAYTPGQGVLLVSGHFANWEVMLTAAAGTGLQGGIVVRPANNPYVDAYLERTRSTIGMKEIIPKGASGLRRMYALLREGGAICILVDQRTSEGILAPFFGREVLTTPAPAALALKLNALVVPVSIERKRGSRFHVHIHPVVTLPDTGDADRDLLALTTILNEFIEERIRARPHEWLWIHRRWTDANAPLRTKRAQALSGRADAESAASNRV